MSASTCRIYDRIDTTSNKQLDCEDDSIETKEHFANATLLHHFAKRHIRCPLQVLPTSDARRPEASGPLVRLGSILHLRLFLFIDPLLTRRQVYCIPH